MTKAISPIDAANAVTPHWMQNIADFDALEIHPCAVVDRDASGTEFIEQCEPEEAHFWTVYGHCRTGGVSAFEDFTTKAEAIAFHDRLLATFAHLRG
jgi:hypothetical protein